MNDSGYRLPPYSEEAERGVLGSIMQDAEKVMGLCMDNGINADSFHIPAHRSLFETLQGMIVDMKPVDLITVGEYLKEQDKLTNMGGYVFLEGLNDSTPTAAHAEYYIGFVRQKHLLRRVIAEATNAIDNCYTETDEDAESILARAQSRLFDVSTASRLDRGQTIGEAAQCVCDDWEEIAAGKKIIGLPPFLPSFRERLGNFVPGNPYFVAAPPGGGKSVFMQNQFLYWALHKVPCAIASLEMTTQKLVSRMIAEIARLNAWQMYNDGYKFTTPAVMAGRLDSARAAAKQLDGLPLHVSDRPMDVDEFCAWGLAQVRKHKIRAIAVDYLQILPPPAKVKLSGIEATAYVCRKLQNFTKETGVIGIVLSQITKLERDKAGHTRRPKQDDLYGGRIIDATSEGTIMIWENDEMQTFFDIAKNRNGGTGPVPVRFNKAFNLFEEMNRQSNNNGG